MPTRLSPDIDLRYHSNNCSICAHPECGQLEDDYANFMNDLDICKKYNVNKYSLEQHCTALRLWIRKAHNIPMIMVKELQRGLRAKPKPRFADLTALAESIRKDLGLYQHRDVALQLSLMSPEAIRELAREALARSFKETGDDEKGVVTIEPQDEQGFILPLTEHSKTIPFTPKPNNDKKLDENTQIT